MYTNQKVSNKEVQVRAQGHPDVRLDCEPVVRRDATSSRTGLCREGNRFFSFCLR